MHTLENAIKAAQCADLLVSDLRALLNSCDTVAGLLVAQELRTSAELANRLDALVAALSDRADR